MSDDNGNKDTRMVCRYGSKCYQKNPLHHQKYKHPPKRGTINPNKNKVTPPETSKRKSDEDDEGESNKKIKVSNDVSDSDSETAIPKFTKEITDSDNELAAVNLSNDVSDSDSESKDTAVKPEHVQVQQTTLPKDKVHHKILPVDMDEKEFIKEKFLCEMPDDFYQFWEFCARIKKDSPAEAFSSIGIHLVGPYDVLAGKFKGIPDRPDEEYLLHWRYYYDPPELQTILKSDKPEGFHIGYFRDNMKEKPIFLASNCSKTDGSFEKIGSNIFAAVFIHLEEIKRSCDPFKKTQVASFLSRVKEESEKLGLDMRRNTDAMRKRFVVAKTNNCLGLNVPYNKRSLVGYRDLTLNDKDLKNLLLKIKSAHPDQMSKLLVELQPVLTYASIALDECDFGTGVKLGWDVLYFGIESLNKTVSQFLCNSYNLLNKPEFAKIAKAHMENRRKTYQPSIL